jgi:hypothetical protein
MVSESIFSGASVIIPMAEVQHIEKVKEGGQDAIRVITRLTTWNNERYDWENPIYLYGEEAEKFKQAWCYYRFEVEGGEKTFSCPK